MSSFTGSLRRALGTRTAATLSLLAGVSIVASGFAPGVLVGAAATADVGNAGIFELDGNIAQNAPTPPPWDWACVFAVTPNCVPGNPPMLDTVFQADYTQPDATYFASSNKDIDNSDTWQCGTLNNPLNKDNILNAYGAAFVPTSGPKKGDLLVYLAQERESNNGESFAGFWLMKSQHTCTPPGTFSNAHDVGDLLVVSNYEGGGDTQSVQLYEWNPGDPSAVNNLVLLKTGGLCGDASADTTNMCAIANDSSNVFTEPWAPNQSLDKNEFVEEGIDLTNLLPAPTSNEDRQCFSDFLSETRSSQELTATLKDYTTGRFSFCVNPTVTTKQTAGQTTSASMVVEAGTPVSDQATLSGTVVGTPKGTIDYQLISGTDCKGTVVYDSGALDLVNGVPPSSGTTTQPVGNYEWVATYSGDVSLGGRNRMGVSTCGDEPLTVVDASVGITPAVAVNKVGSQHVFTITATADVPTGTSVSFTSITPSISPTPSSHSTTCGSPVVNGNVATCTLAINSTSVGTFTANAAAVFNLGGLTVHRSTDGSAGGHGPVGTGSAVKYYVNATIAISPLTAVNVVGAPHTFTVTVTADPGSLSSVLFSAVTFSVLDAGSNGPTQESSTCGSPTINGNVATCTITINNNAPDTFTATASDTVTIGDGAGHSLAMTVTTDGQNGNSAPATKTYGNGTISITPNGVNEVGQPHTFTVTVTGVDGVDTTFNSISTSVLDADNSSPDLENTSTCDNPTITQRNGTTQLADMATCTVTINNSVADVFTANATAHMTVNGFQVTLTTNGQNGSSGPATKTYVDASIAVSPQTAVNAVGDQHVFTITATGLPSSFSVAGTTISYSISPTPGTVSSTCGSPVISGNTATCTVTIDSSTAGVFTLNATAHVMVDGKDLLRSTDSQVAGSGPDGSGPAQKTYVDASVGIGPSAHNPIGQQHVFDIVVTAIPEGTAPVSFDSITPSVSPTPGSMSTTCDNPTINGDQATCTLTIDNDLPDTFVANVAATVTMGGVSVTRSTDGNAGPGGTGPATKNYVTANIGLSPLSADDPVGDLHTLTATVTTNDGSGEGQPAVAPDGTVVNFSIVSGPGSLSSPSCTISNGLGTCTDVLTSSVEGTTVVNATVTLTVDTVELTRSTGDSVPGDSANAVKNWHKVQPSITTVQSTGGTIGTTVSDTATVSGGLNPGGTVTFALYGPTDSTCSSTPVFISAGQPLTNGSAQSATYTPTETGTFQWVATYSGDDANLTAVSGCGDEPVTIVAAAVLGISTPNTGANLMTALAEGLGLVLAGSGIVFWARRRRQQGN